MESRACDDAVGRKNEVLNVISEVYLFFLDFPTTGNVMKIMICVVSG